MRSSFQVAGGTSTFLALHHLRKAIPIWFINLFPLSDWVPFAGTSSDTPWKHLKSKAPASLKRGRIGRSTWAQRCESLSNHFTLYFTQKHMLFLHTLTPLYKVFR